MYRGAQTENMGESETLLPLRSCRSKLVAGTTRITGPTKTGTTMVAKEKGAIRATVKETAAEIQRSVKANSNRVSRVVRKAAPTPQRINLRGRGGGRGGR